MSDIVKPASALVPFRAAAAFTTASRKDASAVPAHSSASGLAKARREIPLASEEGNKSVLQYALYVPKYNPRNPEASIELIL